MVLGAAAGAMTEHSSGEVPERARRRTFTGAYKLKVLAEYEAVAHCPKDKGVLTGCDPVWGVWTRFGNDPREPRGSPAGDAPELSGMPGIGRRAGSPSSSSGGPAIAGASRACQCRFDGSSCGGEVARRRRIWCEITEIGLASLESTFDEQAQRASESLGVLG